MKRRNPHTLSHNHNRFQNRRANIELTTTIEMIYLLNYIFFRITEKSNGIRYNIFSLRLSRHKTLDTIFIFFGFKRKLHPEAVPVRPHINPWITSSGYVLVQSSFVQSLLILMNKQYNVIFNYVSLITLMRSSTPLISYCFTRSTLFHLFLLNCKQNNKTPNPASFPHKFQFSLTVKY